MSNLFVDGRCQPRPPEGELSDGSRSKRDAFRRAFHDFDVAKVDHDPAKAAVTELLDAAGFSAIDLGDLVTGGGMQQFGGPPVGHDLVRMPPDGRWRISGAKPDVLHHFDARVCT